MQKQIRRIVAIASLVAAALAFVAPVHAEKAEKAAAKKTDKPKQSQFTGNIESMDSDAGTVTVKWSGKSKEEKVETFKTTSETKVSTADKPEAALADLKVGDKVMIKFMEVDGAKVAASIKHAAPPKAKAPKEKKPAKAPAE